MDIAYEFVEKIDGAEVADVFRRSGIKRPVDDVERIQRMVDNADLNCDRKKQRSTCWRSKSNYRLLLLLLLVRPCR